MTAPAAWWAGPCGRMNTEIRHTASCVAKDQPPRTGLRARSLEVRADMPARWAVTNFRGGFCSKPRTAPFKANPSASKDGSAWLRRQRQLLPETRSREPPGLAGEAGAAIRAGVRNLSGAGAGRTDGA